MSNIRIEWLNDSFDCETCGTSYAEGARVFIDDKLSINLEPQAHCFNCDDYPQDEVFRRILEHFGHTWENK